MIHDLQAALSLTDVWIRAGHIIFVIFWIAGLFMLPRYYVYHQESAPGSDEEARWIERERKLRSIIINPAMLLTWLFGLTMLWITQDWVFHWFQAKFVLVLGLSGYHGWMVGYGRKLARGERPASGRTLRLMNEIPGLAVVLIVVLVIVKPF